MSSSILPIGRCCADESFPSVPVRGVFTRGARGNARLRPTARKHMKNALTLLVIASLVATASHAESSLTVYGKVDLGLVVDSGNVAGKSVRLSSGIGGGSRLGFRGDEDLGG